MRGRGLKQRKATGFSPRESAIGSNPGRSLRAGTKFNTGQAHEKHT